MGEQADIIKGFGGIRRNVDSLPCVATSHTWGNLLKVLVCEVANFLAGAGWVFMFTVLMRGTQPMPFVCVPYFNYGY